jgi:ubiquinone/menaquinone biosynthesis C-methylase UbiE
MSDWDAIFDRLYLKTFASRTTLESGEEEIAALSRLLALDEPLDVLDTACGFGRHAIPLARAGHRVTGHDRSPVLLQAAHRNSGDTEMRFAQGDYRELALDDASFDLVLNLFSAIGYWGEDGDAQALAEFRRVLRPGGRFVLETMHRDRLAHVYQPRSWDQLEDDGIVTEERELDLVAGVVHTTHRFRPADGPPEGAEYTMRVYTATEIDRMLRTAGFASVEYYGSLGGEPFTIETRLVAVAA